MSLVELKAVSDVAVSQPTCLKEFKAPAPRPSSTPRVALRQTPLAEEVYTAGIQRIIERDYFPELPYLRAKQGLDDAIKTRDPQRIKVAYSELRRCSRTPTGRKIATPARIITGRSATPGTPNSLFSADDASQDHVSVIVEDDEPQTDAIEELVSYSLHANGIIVCVRSFYVCRFQENLWINSQHVTQVRITFQPPK